MQLEIGPPAACPGEAQEGRGDGLGIQQWSSTSLAGGGDHLTGSLKESRPERCGGRSHSFVVLRNQSQHIFCFAQSTRSLRTSPRSSPMTCIAAWAGGKPIPTGSGKQGWGYQPQAPSLLCRERCGGLPQSQASPRASPSPSPAQHGRQASRATP